MTKYRGNAVNFAYCEFKVDEMTQSVLSFNCDVNLMLHQV